MIKDSTQRNGFLFISQKHKVVFFDLKKVASSSIIRYMNENLGAKAFIPNRRLLKPNWYEDYKDYFSFAFVRNPFDRLLSCYKNKILRPSTIEPATGIDFIFTRYGATFHKDMSFKEFLEAILTLQPKDYDPHFSSQYQTLCDENYVPVMDFVGKHETLQRDFDQIVRNRNLPRRLKGLPHLNKSKELKAYNTETIELAKRISGVKEDMKIFNYLYPSEGTLIE